MTNEEKELFNEKISGLGKLINAQFETVHEKLNSIENQAMKTNGRINRAEENIEGIQKKLNDAIIERNNMFYAHTYNCPNAKDIGVCRTKLEKIEKDLEDTMFFVRHPKLFIAIISAIVILSVATFIQSNSWVKNIVHPTQTTELVQKK